MPQKALSFINMAHVKPKPQKKEVKLNLGCGYYQLPSPWINVDKFVPASDDVNFVEADVRELPFEKDYADYIMIDNVLEHLPQADVPVVLYEIRRVLKKGGKALIVVPDFNDIATIWVEYAKGNAYDHNTHKFFAEIIFGSQVHEGEYHKSAFYPPYLSSLLHSVGLHRHELIAAPRGMKTKELKDFDGLRWGENTALRNAQIIAVVTKE